MMLTKIQRCGPSVMDLRRERGTTVGLREEVDYKNHHNSKRKKSCDDDRFDEKLFVVIVL